MNISPDYVESYVTVSVEQPEDFTYHYQHQRITIPAGAQTIIPFRHMVLIAGDPFAVTTNGRRDEEKIRLQHRYGCYGAVDWLDRCPKLKFTDPEGVRYMTVLDDPTGDTGVQRPGTELDLSDRGVLETQIAKMQAQMSQLMQRLNAAESAEQADARAEVKADEPRVTKPVTAPDIKPDMPSTVPVS